MKAIFYNSTTGEIENNIGCSNDVDAESYFQLNIKPSQTILVVDEVVDPFVFYVDQSGVIQPREKQPTLYHQWVNYQWVLNSELQISIESENVRAIRNQLLVDSDWSDTLSAKTRLGDALYNQWQEYRQALRDVTSQAGFPLSIIWPTPPA